MDDGTPEEEFGEEGGQSIGPDFHTPPFECRCIPSVSSIERSETVVPQSESDSFERDSSFVFLFFPQARIHAFAVRVSHFSII